MDKEDLNDSLREECGVMGVIGHSEASNLIYLGLHALQHRGQEACGIVTFKDKSDRISPKTHRAFGLVSDQVSQETINYLVGDIGLGHVRYSTQGGRIHQNIQPFLFKTPSHGFISIAHNGNLTNAEQLRSKLEDEGSIFTTSSDSEVFIHLLAKSRKKRLRERIAEVMPLVHGAYSLVITAKDRLYGIRDPFGFRPLVLGKLGSAWLLASETCALDLIGAQFVRDVEPGEIVRLSKEGVESFFLSDKRGLKAHCAFEPIYFSRPDSKIDGESIYQLRKRMGSQLAMESPVEADIVIPVPDSGVPFALGYAKAATIPFELGLVRNHYVGRTFIEPTQSIRDFGVKLKLNPVTSVIKGRRVIVIDDSLVRGTTCSKIIRMLRQAGAKEIHLKIGSPPITHPCFYGVSTPKRKNLLAAQMSESDICNLVGADSLSYLSIEGLMVALGKGKKNSHCLACFNGRYPELTFGLEQQEPVVVEKIINSKQGCVLLDSTPNKNPEGWNEQH